MNPLVAAFLLLLPPSAARAEKGRVEIVSVSGYEPAVTTRMITPFERLLRHTTDVVLVDIDNVAATYSGTRLRYNMADMPQTELEKLPAGKTVETQAVETVDGYFLLAPAEPEVFQAFFDEAASHPTMPALTRRKAVLRRLEEPGGPYLEAEIASPHAGAAQTRSLIATIYHLQVAGKPVDAVFFLKTTGGLGRAASALAAEPGKDRIVVSRGKWDFRDSPESLSGKTLYEALAKMGVRFSAIGRGELRHWDDAMGYAQAEPEGLQFLSANLQRDGAPVVRATATVEAGLKVGFIGLTRGNYGKYLGRGSLKGLTIIDPVEAARGFIRDLREESDIVVALTNLSQADNARLRSMVRGLDVIIGDSEESEPETRDSRKQRLEERRGGFPPALLIANEYPDALCRIEATLGEPENDGARPLSLEVRHIRLDDTLKDSSGFPQFDAKRFELALSTEPALLPPAHKLFPPSERRVGGSRMPRVTQRDFWTLAASLIADRTHAEAALLPETTLGANLPGDFTERQIASWFGWDDGLVVFELPGSDLASLLQEAAAQKDKEARDLPLPPGQLRLAAGGIGEDNKIHGVDVDSGLAPLWERQIAAALELVDRVDQALRPVLGAGALAAAVARYKPVAAR